MTRFKYLLAIFAAGNWYASAFLIYLIPTLAWWLPWIGLVCCFPLFFLSLGALFKQRWMAVIIFSVAWVAIALFFLDLSEPFSWLRIQGFRIHASPVKRYLSRCRLIAFVENGIEQQLGQCEAIDRSWNDWEYIFFDTTGQFVLPPPQRTQAWRDAMYNFSSHCYLSEKAVANHLFGHFYAVVITSDYADGC